MPLLRRLGVHARAHLVAFVALVLALVLVSAVPAWAAISVGPSDIKKSAVRSKHLKNGQVKTVDLGVNAVTGSRLAPNAVTGSDIAPNAVTGSDIAPNSVTGSDVDESSLHLGRSFDLGARTITNGNANLTIEVPRELVDRSMIQVLYNPAAELESAWYPAPGFGSGGLYQMRYLLYQSNSAPSTYTLALRVLKPDGTIYTTALELRRLKVSFLPVG